MNAQGYYRVPEVNLDGLRLDIEKLNKRAAKLGVAPIHFAVMDWEAVTLTHPVTAQEYVRRYALVDIVGETPKLNGYVFAAKVEPTEAGNLVKLMPGVANIPERFYTSAMDCEHCHTSRRRNEVFVVKYEEKDDGYVQVGRNCLADFLGGTSPETLANIAEWLAEIREMGEDYDDERGYGTRGIDIGEPTEAFVAAVAAFARYEGYVSKAKAEFGGIPTVARAWMWLRPSCEADRDEIENLTQDGFAIEERDIALAAKAIAWAQNLSPSWDNNFEMNLKTSASLEWVDHKTGGIMSALVGSYLRAQEKIIREQVQRERSKDLVHLGVEGQRQSFADLTISHVRSFDGDYGVRTLVSFLDPDGNVLTWWTGYQPDWVEQGKTVTVKATVKKHDAYRGVPQTVLTRVNEVTA
jgi:hypothetical protein